MDIARITTIMEKQDSAYKALFRNLAAYLGHAPKNELGKQIEVVTIATDPQTLAQVEKISRDHQWDVGPWHYITRVRLGDGKKPATMETVPRYTPVGFRTAWTGDQASWRTFVTTFHLSEVNGRRHEGYRTVDTNIEYA